MQIKKLTKEPEKLLVKLEKVLTYYDLKEKVLVEEIKQAIFNAVAPKELIRRYFANLNFASDREAENFQRLILDLYYNLPQRRYGNKSYLEFQTQGGFGKLAEIKVKDEIFGFSKDLSIAEEFDKEMEQKLKGFRNVLQQLDINFNNRPQAGTTFFNNLEDFSPTPTAPFDLELQSPEEVIPSEYHALYRQAVAFTIKANKLIKPLVNKKGVDPVFKKLAFSSLSVSGKIVGAFIGTEKLADNQEELNIQLDLLEDGFTALQQCLEAIVTIKKKKLLQSEILDQLLELGGDVYFEYLKNIEGLRRKLART